jgi:hypothetical protein
MSLTVFFALCILGIDFLIYFFFKLIYGEKHRAHPRRLPPEYYDDSYSGRRKSRSSSLYLVPGKKNDPGRAKGILSMPSPQLNRSGEGTRRRRQDAGVPPRNFAEMLAYRRATARFAQVKLRQ